LHHFYADVLKLLAKLLRFVNSYQLNVYYILKVDGSSLFFTILYVV